MASSSSSSMKRWKEQNPVTDVQGWLFKDESDTQSNHASDLGM